MATQKRAGDDPLRERLRSRLLRLLRVLSADEAPIRITYDGAERYWHGGTRWLPRQATLSFEIEERHGISHPLRDVVLELHAGPEEIYKYQPFSCWVYVEDRAAAVAEFDRAQQKREVAIRVPVGKPVSVTIINELSGKPKGERRDLALILKGVRLGRVVASASEGAPEPPRAFSQQLFPLVDKPPRPVFVVGAYRSGTSVLAWALGQHPNIWPLEETNFLAQLALGAASGHRRVIDAPRNFFDIYDISAEEYTAYVGLSLDRFIKTASLRLYNRVNLRRLSIKEDPDADGAFHPAFQLARSSFNSKQRWVDGTPENAHNIFLLRELFPESRFILTVRDPFDVIASMMNFERAGGVPTSPSAAAAMWLRLMNAGYQAYRAFGPSVIRVVPFEDLAGRTVGTLSRIFDFLNEPQFPQSSATYQKRINSSQVDPQIRRNIVSTLRATLDEREQLSTLYGQIRRCTWLPWERDQKALSSLRAEQNDKVTRAAKTLL